MNYIGPVLQRTIQTMMFNTAVDKSKLVIIIIVNQAHEGSTKRYVLHSIVKGTPV
jgi:hypothetical protein